MFDYTYNNNYTVLRQKSQYEIIGNIEKDTTTGRMSAVVRVKAPDGKVYLPQIITRSSLIQKGISALSFLYDCGAGLDRDDLKAIKESLFCLFQEPGPIVEQAEKISEQEVYERLEEFIWNNSMEPSVTDKSLLLVNPTAFTKDGFGYIATQTFGTFISADREMGWKRLDVLKMLKREGLLQTDKDKTYEKKVKCNGVTRNYYAIKLFHDKDGELLASVADKTTGTKKEEGADGN